LQEEVAWHGNAAQRAEKEVVALDTREQGLRQQLEAAERQRSALADELESRQKQLEALPVEELQRASLAAESEVASVARIYQEQERALQGERRNQQRLDEQLAAKTQRRAELQADIENALMRLGKIQGEAAILRQRLDGLRQQIEPAEDQVVSLDRSEKQARDGQEQSRSRLHELETEGQQIALDHRLAQDELQRLQKQIEEDLGPVTLPQRYPQQLRLSLDNSESKLPPLAILPDNLEADIRELRARVRRLGGFNPNAPSEYKELLERHTFLANQSADLEKAIESLHKVIAELDEVMEREFAQTFAAVAQAFSEYFTLLFGGGTAKLTLADAEESAASDAAASDAADSGAAAPGIEIIARPPGKRLQNLALLSGGERALTASALLFAILKIKPLPFCVLDEVDAMLDEANVGRFRDALREMSARTQFIIITHNRHTINAADTIYGISMRQDGVSTALSLRMEEAEREAGLIAEEA
jgi:chromosome segregation protein